MAIALLVLVVVLVIAALVFGVVTLLSGDDPGLVPVDADSRSLPLPNHRSLTEVDLKSVRFDVQLRGYRMAQVDRVLRRTAYDVGYKDEMIAVLEAEVSALREGRREDAELLRKARESASSPVPTTPATTPGAHRARNAAGDSTEQNPGEAPDEAPNEAADAGSQEQRLDQDTKQRLDEDRESTLTEDPQREPAGEAEIPEEKAAEAVPDERGVDDRGPDEQGSEEPAASDRVEEQAAEAAAEEKATRG